MELCLFIWALLLVLGVNGSAAASCPASKGTSLNLSVVSRRNLTGHWIVSVDSARVVPEQPSSNSSPMEMALDIWYRTATCEGLQTVRLTATAVLDAVSAAQKAQDKSSITTSLPPMATATVDEPRTVAESTSQGTLTLSEEHMTAAASAVPTSTIETTSQAPPAGYEVVNGLGYYKMHTNPLIWEQAREKCVQEGAHLIVINSDQEAEVAKTLFKRDQTKIQGASSKNFAYVGFDDIVTEGNFTTVLGESLLRSGYNRWRPDISQDNRDWNCGIILTDASLDTHNCKFKFGFICEFSAQ